MDEQTYFDYRADLLAAACNLSDVKRADYAHDADVLANFKRTADQLMLEPEQVAVVFLNKHLDAISRAVNEISRGRDPDREGSEPIRGRFKDALNYLCLLSALIYERFHMGVGDYEQSTSEVYAGGSTAGADGDGGEGVKNLDTTLLPR